MKKAPKFIDLFCGAGGLSQGLINAGFELLWAIDNEEKCKPTFDTNHKIKMTIADIQGYDPPDLGLKKGELDLIAGGPPCPTFSLVGRTKINSLKVRDINNDERNLLYKEFLRFVDFYRPKIFLMENVKGLMSATNSDEKSVVEIIKKEMDSLGYEVNVQLLNASDFGVPQNRKRVFFVGNRLGINNPNFKDWETHREPLNNQEKMIKFLHKNKRVRFPTFQKHIQKKPWNTVAEAILDLPPVSPEGTRPPKKMTEYTIPAISIYQKWARNLKRKNWEKGTLHNHECRGHNMRDLTIYKLLGEGVSWIIGNLPEDAQPYRTDIFPDKYKKQNPKEPSSTIVAHLHKDGNMFIHPHEARTITVREAARFQSFKDTFIFPEARTHAFKQVGNAVPPLLAEAVGTAIKSDLLDLYANTRHLIDQISLKNLRKELIKWEYQNYEKFPWRDTENNFHALLAELMLQRTKAEQVLCVYTEFVERYRNIGSLKKVRRKEILKILSSLGLHWRLNNIIELINSLLEMGSIPDSYAELIELPGIGDYTASAYLSFHKNQSFPIIDSNAIRLWSRIFGIRNESRLRRDKNFRDLISVVTPTLNCKMFNYGVLDLSRKVCTKNPNHDECPLKEFCMEVSTN